MFTIRSCRNYREPVATARTIEEAIYLCQLQDGGYELVAVDSDGVVVADRFGEYSHAQRVYATANAY